MKLKTADTLGRATFYHIDRIDLVRPTERELRWIRHIERHGPQSSQCLFELTHDTHRCKDSALRAMQKLRAGMFLALPRQQRLIERAEFNPYIYDVTKVARHYLIDLGLDEPTVRPTGHWWHGYTVARVTSAIDMAAQAAGVRYIPAHEILAIKGVDLAIPVGRSRLIPDQLFALDYGGRFRVFSLEVDRGTEPKTSATMRKSWGRSIELYAQILDRQIHRSHYGLKSNLLLLWVFTCLGKERRFLEMVATHAGRYASHFLTRVIDADICIKHTYDPKALYTGLWNRCNGTPVSISGG